MDNPAPVDHPVHELVRDRWSPRAFADTAIEETVLRSLLEAARWAPSANNKQPWRFLVARREEPDELARMLACLVPGNQRWAHKAAVLMVAVATTESYQGRQRSYAFYDTAQAVAWLSCEATARGIRVHQMGGIDADKVRQIYGVPDDDQPMVAIALGYPGDPDALEDDLKQREIAPRVRHPQSELVFSRSWGEPR